MGIGINIRELDCPDDIKDIAGSLFSCTGILVERSVLAARVVENLDSYSHDFMDDYRARSVVLGKTVRVINSEGEYLARALSIEDDGSLKVLCNDGKEKNLCFGEISLRLDKDGRV